MTNKAETDLEAALNSRDIEHLKESLDSHIRSNERQLGSIITKLDEIKGEHFHNENRLLECKVSLTAELKEHINDRYVSIPMMELNKKQTQEEINAMSVRNDKSNEILMNVARRLTWMATGFGAACTLIISGLLIYFKIYP